MAVFIAKFILFDEVRNFRFSSEKKIGEISFEEVAVKMNRPEKFIISIEKAEK